MGAKAATSVSGNTVKRLSPPDGRRGATWSPIDPHHFDVGRESVSYQWRENTIMSDANHPT
jgi:hypothetical protein